MTEDQSNPYAPPATDSATAAFPEQYDPVAARKAEAIIKDAGQFWVAILLCIFCSGLGAIIIGPWYLVRLIQWNALAQNQPLLLDPNVPRGSLPQKFQAAKLKLILGMSIGALILIVAVLLIATSLATVRRAGV